MLMRQYYLRYREVILMIQLVRSAEIQDDELPGLESARNCSSYPSQS
jgi:hypothetical protein